MKSDYKIVKNNPFTIIQKRFEVLPMILPAQNCQYGRRNIAAKMK